jgi:hypothetical protein
VLAPETLRGSRIVASAAALDAVDWPEGTTVLRFAPDDVFAIGLLDPGSIRVADEYAITADESGYVGCWLDQAGLAHVAAHIEWPLPSERPALAQGFVAGVPAKLYLADTAEVDTAALLLTNAPYADELWGRLS